MTGTRKPPPGWASGPRPDQADLQRRVLTIIQALHGLPVGAAEHVLGEAGRIMKTMVVVNLDCPGFAEFVQETGELFETEGDPSQAN